MKEILIVTGFIMLVFSYRSISEWLQNKKDDEHSPQKRSNISEDSFS